MTMPQHMEILPRMTMPLLTEPPPPMTMPHLMTTPPLGTIPPLMATRQLMTTPPLGITPLLMVTLTATETTPATEGISIRVPARESFEFTSKTKIIFSNKILNHKLTFSLFL